MCDMNRLTDKEFFELKYYKYKAKVQQTKIEITDELSMAVSEKQKEIQEMREIINRLKEEIALTESVSFTTRPKRTGDVHGQHYFFVTPDEFLKMKSNNE